MDIPKVSGNINKILVPVDFSAQSLIALEQAFDLALEYSSEITLLYVNEGPGISKRVSKQDDDTLHTTMKDNLDKLAKEGHLKTGLKINSVLKTGNAYDEIVKTSNDLNSSLIVMGCNCGNEKKKIIGANSLRVITEAKCPVITLKGRHKINGLKNIVLPLDLQKETHEKVTCAIKLAQSGRNTAIRVVSILFSTDEFIVNRLIRHLAQVKNRIEAENIECTAEIVKGIKGEETLAQNIIDYASHMDGDVIMVMTQQETDSTEFFIGSSAREIINYSEIPVLTIIPSLKKNLIIN